MSFVFGAGRGREDPELAAGNRRTRLHYARDVNDERALAGDRPTVHRSRHWTWLVVVAGALAVLAVAGGRGAEDVPLAADCGTAAIAVQTSAVTAGQPLRFRLTGPDDAPYVVTLDGEPVRGYAGSAGAGSATGPEVELQQCLSPTLVVATPAGDGPHRLAMLRVASDGSTRPVAEVVVTVSGTR